MAVSAWACTTYWGFIWMGLFIQVGGLMMSDATSSSCSRGDTVSSQHAAVPCSHICYVCSCKGQTRATNICFHLMHHSATRHTCVES
jgi:hypothetical protein